jgi:K+-transporting ATPase ATPase A chain
LRWGITAWLQVAAIIAVVVILHVPLGNYMARVYSATGDWRVERAIYRVVGVQPGDRQRWTKYLSSLLAFSAASVLLLYGLLLLQAYLTQPWGHKE